MGHIKEEKIVLVSGRFNVVHPGHLRLLRFAKECGGRLIVAVESDRLAGNAAHVPDHLRLEGVACNSYVDEAFLIDSPVDEIIKKLRPDLVVKGKEHENRNNPEKAILDSYGGELLFSSGETVFSSLDLMRQEFSEAGSKTIKLPHEYLKRNKIGKTQLAQLCKSFSKLRVVVVGDLIVDEYITCQPLGMSQEDPTIVVTPIDSSRFVGGAGIVAAHAAGLGAKVDFVSVSGMDASRDFAIEKLTEYNVGTIILEDKSRPTTLKQRYRCNGKSMLRVSHLHQGAISLELQKKIISELAIIMKDVDLLVFSDFNYGCLPQTMVELVICLAKENNVMLAADSQSSSQFGDISRFRGMDLITPTEREARLAVRNQEDGLVVLAEKLQQLSNAKHILLKLAEEGLLVQTWRDIENGTNTTDQVPALNSNPKDVAGAGDSLLIVSSLAMASGASIWEAGCLGSMAAAIQVGRVGNTPLQLEQLLSEISA